MNINFGLFPPLPQKIPKKEKGQHYAERSIKALNKWKAEAGFCQVIHLIC